MDQRATAEAPQRAVIFVLAATVGFAFKGIWARYAYQAGLTVAAVLLLRVLMATPLYWLGARGLKAPEDAAPLTVRDRIISLGCGVFFMAAAACDFIAIDKIGAGPSRVILFSFPGFVLIIDAARQRRWPPWRQGIAFVVAWVGLVLVAAPHGLAGVKTNVGVLWALGGAVTYAIYLTVSQPVTQRLGSIRFVTWSNYGTTLALLAVFPFLATKADFQFSGSGVAWVVVLAVVSTTIPFFLLFEGIRRAGAVKASLITLVGPPITVFAAWGLLDEQLTSTQLLGTALVLVGVGSLKR